MLIIKLYITTEVAKATTGYTCCICNHNDINTIQGYILKLLACECCVNIEWISCLISKSESRKKFFSDLLQNSLNSSYVIMRLYKIKTYIVISAFLKKIEDPEWNCNSDDAWVAAQWCDHQPVTSIWRWRRKIQTLLLLELSSPF